MRHYGIIGFPLEHSFSARYFTEKFAREGIDADYRLYPIADITNVEEMLQTQDGMNVTLPYKQAVMPYLSEIDDVAHAIGAVNVVRGRKGYNTDWIGFVRSLQPLLLPTDTKALILGTGGVSKAVQYGLRTLGIPYTMVSRHPQAEVISYADITPQVLDGHAIIINCTPLGMYPNIATYPPLQYERLGAKHLLYDCVYNPGQTEFLRRGKQQGARTKNGLEMLYLQADAAWEIWNQ